MGAGCLSFFIGLGTLILILVLLGKSVGIIFRLVLNGLLGGLLLYLGNLVAVKYGLEIPITPLTAVVAGILGVPGVLLLFVLAYFVRR